MGIGARLKYSGFALGKEEAEPYSLIVIKAIK